MKHDNSPKGFTLVEVILAVVVLGIIALLITNPFREVTEGANVRNMESKLLAVFAAQQSYKMRVENAQATFSATTSDEQRFDLIAPYLPGAPTGSAADLVAFANEGIGSDVTTNTIFIPQDLDARPTMDLQF